MFIKPNAIFTNRQNVILPLQAAKVCLNLGIANNIFCLNYVTCAHDHDIIIIYPYKNEHIIPLALHNMKIALYKLGAQHPNMQICLCVLLKSGKSWFYRPNRVTRKVPPRETLSFLGNKINCFPQDQSLSVKHCLI